MEQTETKPEIKNSGKVVISVPTLKVFLNELAATCDEAEIKVKAGEQLIKAATMDPSQISMIALEATISQLETEREEGYFFLDVATLNKALKIEKAGEVIISWDGEETKVKTPQLSLDMRGCLGGDGKMPKLPEVPFTATAKVINSDISAILKDMNRTKATHFKFNWSCGISDLSLESESNALGGSAVILNKKVGFIEGITAEGKSVFPLSYFRETLGAIGKKTALIISLGMDKPCRLNWSELNGDVKGSWWLAPRIESTDDEAPQPAPAPEVVETPVVPTSGAAGQVGAVEVKEGG
jgi:hypothetical protein